MNGDAINVAANRAARKWSRRELVGRALWEILSPPLFAWTPRPLWAWRRFVLRAFGARIGADVHIFPTVRIPVPWNLEIGSQSAVGDGAVLYCLGRIVIGRGATISQYAHLCAGTHDYRSADMPLVKAEITIGHNAWICADAFVGPGVEIGDLAIVGARAVAMSDVPYGAIVVGNPARFMRMRPLLQSLHLKPPTEPM